MLLIWMVTALPFAFVCVLLLIMPSLSRRTQFFAVTVSPEFRQSAEARRIIRKYRAQVAVHCAIALACFATLILLRAPGWLPAVFVWPALGTLVAVILAHRESLAFAVPAGSFRRASLTSRTGRLAGGALWWAGPFVLLGLAGGYIFLRWNEIPARFAVHWGFNNQPNGWADRTVSGVYRPLGLGVVVCLMLFFLAWQLRTNSRGSTAMRELTTRVLTAVSYFVAGVFGWLTVVLPLGHGAPSPLNMGVIMGALALIIGGIIVYGMRAKSEPEPGTAPVTGPQSILGLGDNTADRDWVGGLFYFNPEDPAVFVEKRIGIGYDLNFGNPRSWVFLGAIVLLPLALVLITKS